jgi:chromosome segregation ATPase
MALEEERKANEKMLLQAKDTEDELRWTLSKSFHLSECLSISEKQVIEMKQRISELTEQMRNMELKSVQLKFQVSRLEEENRELHQTTNKLGKENRELRKELSKYQKPDFPKLEKKIDRMEHNNKMANLATTLNALTSLKHKF